MYLIPTTDINSFVTKLTSKTRYLYAAEFCKRSLTNRDDLIEGILNVYESGVPFQTGKQKYTGYDYRTTLIMLADRVHAFFNDGPNYDNTQSNFDMFHKSLCEFFLESINSQRSACGLPDLSYGNAQKLINMYFKYLACYGDYPRFASLFEHCHMPIDRFALDGLSGIGVSNISGNVKYSMYYDNLSWTKFDYSTYIRLVNDYRTKFRPNLSALYYDFCIWGKASITIPTSGVMSTPIAKFYM